MKAIKNPCAMQIVKLVGDMSSNIEEIVMGMGCRCGAMQQIRNVMEIYAMKIHKLRQQRDQYRSKCQMLEKQINISNLQKQNSTLNIFQLMFSQEITEHISSMEQQISESISTNSEQSLLLTPSPSPSPSLDNFYDFIQSKIEQRLCSKKMTNDIQYLHQQKQWKSKNILKKEPLREQSRNIFN